MKKVTFICIILSLLASCASSISFTSEMKNNIEAKKITIHVENIYPMSGSVVMDASGYSLQIKGDSVYSYLPYYGRAYQLPYGGGKGLTFNSRINKYNQKYDKKGLSEITLSTKTDEDTYTFTITLSPTKSASVYLQCNNRQPITYIGHWE